MPDFTNAFTKVFDALRLVSRPITRPSADLLKLYDEDGATIATLTTGWFTDELSQEQTFERINELHITDRAGIAFEDAVAFGFGGYRYERSRFPNPPLNNPREWVFLIKPVGLDISDIGAFDLVDDAGIQIVDDLGNQIVAV